MGFHCERKKKTSKFRLTLDFKKNYFDFLIFKQLKLKELQLKIDRKTSFF